MRQLLGTYAGVVESISDPEKLGRVKVRVPTVYGPAQGSIQTPGLPWALPAGLPAGGSGRSGGIDWPPEIGDQVWVRFIDGEPEKPVWEWALQNVAQAKTLPFRNYTGSTPNRHALLTRYGQSIELAEAGVTVTTAHGYSMQLIDGNNNDGSIELRTGKAYLFQMLDSTDQLTLFIKYVHASYDDLSFLGSTSTFTMSDNFQIVAPRTNIKSNRIDLGNGANDPIIRRSDLDRVCQQIVMWANSHTHPDTPPTDTPCVLRTTFSRTVYAT